MTHRARPLPYFLALLFFCLPLVAQNLLTNPGFEEGSAALPDGWRHYQPEYAAHFALDTRLAKSGSRSMRLTGAGPKILLSLSSRTLRDPKRAGGFSYGGSVAGRISEGRCLVRVREIDGNGLSLRYHELPFPVSETWTTRRARLPAPDPRCRELQVYLTLDGVTGAVWFDDLFLGEAAELPPEPAPAPSPIYANHFELPYFFADETVVDRAGRLAHTTVSGPTGRCLRLASADGRPASGAFEKVLLACFPGDSYQLTARMAASNGATGVLSVRLEDGEHRPTGSAAVALGAASNWASLALPFRVPPKTCYVILSASMEDASGKGILEVDDLVLEKVAVVEGAKPGYWQALWISAHEGDAEIQGATYYRKAFVLAKGASKKLLKALLLLASNMGSTLSVNGTEVGRSDSWRLARRFDLRPYLRDGTNLIAVMPVNTRASSRVLAELHLAIEGEAASVLPSDSTWKASRFFSPGWNLPEFDDRAWAPAFVYGRPPIGPYGDLPYPLEPPDPADTTRIPATGSAILTQAVESHAASRRLSGNRVTSSGSPREAPLFAYKLPIDIDPLPRLAGASNFVAAGGRFLVLQVAFDPKAEMREKLGRYVAAAAARYPQCDFFVSLATDPDGAWLAEHPDARVVDAEGMPGDYASFASPAYRARLEAYVGDLVGSLARSPWRDRIAGVELEGGEDAQWMHHSGYRKTLPDYSEAMR